MRVQQSKVNILDFASWKHELAMQVFGWFSKANGSNPGYPQDQFEIWRNVYLHAADFVTWVFTPDGFAGTSLLFAQEVGGPVIVSKPFLPDDVERPNTTVEPLSILKYIEDELDKMAQDDFEEGIYKVLRHAIFQIRSSWFCDHEWMESMYPEMADGHQIKIEVCRKCQSEREMAE